MCRCVYIGIRVCCVCRCVSVCRCVYAFRYGRSCVASVCVCVCVLVQQVRVSRYPCYHAGHVQHAFCTTQHPPLNSLDTRLPLSEQGCSENCTGWRDAILVYLCSAVQYAMTHSHTYTLTHTHTHLHTPTHTYTHTCT